MTDDKDDRFIAIAPTQNDSIYQIWIDDNPYPVMNPPSMAEDVLRGVRDAIQAPADYGQLNDVYERIRSKQVRRYVIDKAMSLFPKSEVVPEDEGWNVMGIFLLTWDARVFLNTGSVEDQSSYRVRGSGVSETDEAKEFLQLHVNDEVFEQYRDLELEIHYPLPKQMDFDGHEVISKECPTCGNKNAYKYHDIQRAVQGSQSQPQRPVYICTDESCGQSWQTYDLTEREIEFISKARWLLDHRENLDDDAFWDVIESYVWKGGQ